MPNSLRYKLVSAGYLLCCHIKKTTKERGNKIHKNWKRRREERKSTSCCHVFQFALTLRKSSAQHAAITTSTLHPMNTSITCESSREEQDRTGREKDLTHRTYKKKDMKEKDVCYTSYHVAFLHVPLKASPTNNCSISLTKHDHKKGEVLKW